MVVWRQHEYSPALSTLNLVGKKGIQQKILSPLNEEEVAKLHASAAKLKEIIASLDI